jgi:hypothetical protein
MLERAIVTGMVVIVVVSMLAANLPRIVGPITIIVVLYLAVRLVNAWTNRW